VVAVERPHGRARAAVVLARTLVRALIGGLVGAVVGAVGSALQGNSWVGGAVLFGWLGVLGVLLVRVLVLSDARNRPRRRD
jgi:hypothetical protein